MGNETPAPDSSGLYIVTKYDYSADTGWLTGTFDNKDRETQREYDALGRQPPEPPSWPFSPFTLAAKADYNDHNRDKQKSLENPRVETMGTRVDNRAFDIEHSSLAFSDSAANRSPAHQHQPTPQNQHNAPGHEYAKAPPPITPATSYTRQTKAGRDDKTVWQGRAFEIVDRPQGPEVKPSSSSVLSLKGSDSLAQGRASAPPWVSGTNIQTSPERYHVAKQASLGQYDRRFSWVQRTLPRN